MQRGAWPQLEAKLNALSIAMSVNDVPVIRGMLQELVSGYRVEFNGAEDYDFFWRTGERAAPAPPAGHPAAAFPHG